MQRAQLVSSGGGMALAKSRHAATQGAVVVSAYVLAYVFLDWVSYIHPAGPYAITVWNPPPGLSLALLLGGGLRYAPALFLAAALAEIIVRHGQAQLAHVALFAAILAIGYTALAAALRRSRFEPSFDSLRDLLLFVLVVGAGAIVIAALYVGAHVLTGHVPPSEFPAHTAYFWVGDVIGIATTTPFLLIYGRRLQRGERPRLTREGVLQALSIALVLALIYRLEPERAANLFYLLFMPLVWISTRYGFPGATAGLLATQLGLIGALQLANYTSAWVLQFQFLMLALTVTGAFLGMASTQWRRARLELQSREAELKTLFATAPDAIVILDADTRVIGANAAAEAMFHLPAPQVTGRNLTDFIDLPADFVTGKHAAIMARARRANGGAFPVEVSFGSATAGERRLHIAIVRDVSERQAMETQLREREQHLERTLRLAAAAEMAATLAHELNQPLTAASAYIQSLDLMLARHDGRAASITETMRKAGSEVARAGTIVRRLREFYRHEPGVIETLAVHALIDGAIDGLRSRMERHRVRLSVDVAEGTPELLVDRVQVEMVLQNVLRNAIDAIAESHVHDGRIAIRASAHEPEFVAIEIADSGPGVKTEIAGQIFESFVTSRKDGTGLGLAISRSIVERHGGRLWLEQNDGGARFVMTLPATRGQGDLC